MSNDPQDNAPSSWNWTPETMDEHAEAHAPANRAHDESRRPEGAYATAERFAADHDLRPVANERAILRNQELQKEGFAPSTSPTYWAKHAKSDKLGNVYAANTAAPADDPWQEKPMRSGRHSK